MSEKSILIVEENTSLRESLLETVELAGFQSLAAKNAKEAWTIMTRAKPNLLVSDVQLADSNGFEFLQKIQEKYAGMAVILMAANANVVDAVKAIKLGAIDYLEKPFEAQLLIDKIKQFAGQDKASRAVSDTNGPIAADPNSRQLLMLAQRVAASQATILITGQSGTGKEVLARYIHQYSTRSDKPFVAVNCAAIPDNMLESTLFGYEKGAFTGAIQAHPGKFEQAQGGTLLLDEISEMDLNLQAKLLRVIQEKEVERLGGRKTIKLDVRLIATSNRILQQEVKQGLFREDLFYRLNVFPLQWLPLSQRPKDIIPLAEYFISRHRSEHQAQEPQLDAAATEKLMAYIWPGNGREVDNVMQRALIMAKGNQITADDIQFEVNDMLVSELCICDD